MARLKVCNKIAAFEPIYMDQKSELLPSRSANALGLIRKVLHKSSLYWQLRECMDEGFSKSIHRIPIQRAILKTNPVLTPKSGRAEVHILAYHKDWLNAIWALKSLYVWPGTDFPLFIHDGGLLPTQIKTLRTHFPNAHFSVEPDSSNVLEPNLRKRGLTASIEFRRINKLTRKIYDFEYLSETKRIITMDPDVIFFERPEELIEAATVNRQQNYFNRDFQYGYSLPQEEMDSVAGVRVPAFFNSGLGCYSTENIDLQMVEKFFAEGTFSIRDWLAEQSVLAITFAKAGFQFLSDKYLIGCEHGIPEGTVAKHYPSWPRPYLYQEGMQKVKNSAQWKRLAA